MPNRKSKLIYLSPDLTRKIEIAFTKSRVRWIIAAGIVLFFLINSTAGYLVSHLLTSQENAALSRENQALREHLEDAEIRLTAVNEKLSVLAETDNMLRLMADLPLMHDDVREVGVGGGLGDPVTVPEVPVVTENVWSLEKVERELELQQASFEEIRQKLTENAELLEHTPSLRPVEGGYISSGFGVRRDPFTKRLAQHYGTDIVMPRGSQVVATAEGQVIYAGRYYNYGKFIVIDHGFDYQTAYGHLHKIHVKKGQYVSKGQQIGSVGSTGRSTGPHVHYEVRVNGRPVDPMDYFFDEVTSFPVLATRR